MKTEIKKYNIHINQQPFNMYQKKDNSFVHFHFKNEWFKIKYKQIKDVNEFYDAKFLLTL